MTDEPEVILETFLGHVDKIEDGIAYFHIESRSNGDVLYGQYPTAKLEGIIAEESDQCLIHTVAKGEWTRLRFEKVEPREITDEEALEIKRKIEAVLGEYRPGDDY